MRLPVSRKSSRQIAPGNLPRPNGMGLWVTPLVFSSIVTLLLVATSGSAVTQFQTAIAFALIAIPCFAYADWRQTRRTQIPLFAVLAAAHAVFYCVSVLSTGLLDQSAERTSTAVLGMALLGVCSLFVGMRTGASSLLVQRVTLPDVPFDISKQWFIRAIAAFQIIVPFLPVGAGGGFRQVIAILLSFVPFVAFLLLWDVWLKGKATLSDKAVVVVFLVASVVGGLASGWLTSSVGVFILAGVGFVRVRGRIPLIPLVGVAFVMLFLQAGKSEFRDRYWYGGDQAGVAEKARFWIESSAVHLSGFILQPGTESFRDLFEAPFLTRSSLASEAATVYEKTPLYVPYQYGATYQSLLITWIPRFVWPGKPSVNDSNRFYQVSYGVTQQEDLDHVAIGAGLIPEAYMNFGWLGVPFVMFLGGVVLGAFESLFLGRRAGAFASAVGLAYVLQLLELNGQAAAYFGGMVQIIGLTFIIFLPVLHFGTRTSSAPTSWRTRFRPAVSQ